MVFGTVMEIKEEKEENDVEENAYKSVIKMIEKEY
jgi:hypothetical protein